MCNIRVRASLCIGKVLLTGLDGLCHCCTSSLVSFRAQCHTRSCVASLKNGAITFRYLRVSSPFTPAIHGPYKFSGDTMSLALGHDRPSCIMTLGSQVHMVFPCGETVRKVSAPMRSNGLRPWCQTPQNPISLEIFSAAASRWKSLNRRDPLLAAWDELKQWQCESLDGEPPVGHGKYTSTVSQHSIFGNGYKYGTIVYGSPLMRAARMLQR